MMNERDFVRLEAQLQESWLIRGADRIADACVHAGDRSRSARLIRGVRERFLALPVDQRVRAAAAFVAAAATGHLLILRLVPAHVAPALPRLLWVLVAATALIVAVLADRLTEAWNSSLVCRVWREVTAHATR
jgi:hypothetical protein